MIWEAERLPTALLKDAGIPESFFGDGRLEGYWRRNPAEMGGGEFADTGSHMVDLALWLGGAPPVAVAACTESAGMPVDRIVQVQARLANDVLLSLAAVDGVPGAPRWRLAVYGDLGVMTADWEGWAASDIWLDAEERARLDVEISDSTVAAEFVRGVKGESASLASSREGAYAVALTEAAYRAASEKQWIHLEIPEI